jgi:hypothetical protein
MLASGAAATLVIKVVSDVQDATKGLEGVGSTVDKVSGTIGSLALPAAAVGTALLGMAKAASEDRDEANKLTKIIEEAGAAHGDYAKQVDDAIAAGQAKAFSDSESRDALASLVTATGDVTKATTGLATAQDIARFAGVDLATAADAVAKAQAGQDGALRKLLPGLEKGKTATDTLAAAQAQAAGQADLYAASTEGQLATVQDSVGELGETIGSVFLPVLDSLTGALTGVAAILRDNEGVVKAVALVVGIFAGAILAANVALAAYRAVMTIVQVAQGAMTAAQWLLNAALSANPIGLVVLAIIALVAILAIAWAKSETFRNIVTGVFKTVQSVVETVIGVIGTLFGGLLAILRAPIDAFAPVADAVFKGLQKIVETVIGVIKNLFAGLGAILSAPFDAFLEAAKRVIGAVEGLFRGLADAINGIIGGIRDTLKGIGDAINSLPKLPFSAIAPPPGPVPAPALFGAPRTARGRARAGSGGGVTVNVYGGDTRRVTAAVRDGFRRWKELDGTSAPDRDY